MENIAPIFIDGKWEKIKTSEFNEVYNPATEEIISLTPICNKNEVERAVESSLKAFNSNDLPLFVREKTTRMTK